MIITLKKKSSQGRRGVGLTKPEATVMLAEVSTALDYLHSRQVLHGNVRPENVRIDLGGHARLAGFNYAQVGNQGGGRIKKNE